jgi:hypothetical protein
VSIYRIISAEKASFPVSVMCEVLGVSRSGFHAWERRAPSDRALADAWLTEKIKEIHEQARGVYGSRRVCRPSCALATVSRFRASVCSA